MAGSMMPFVYENHHIRVVMQNGEPWFVARDVCDVLGIVSPSSVYDRLDGEDIGVTDVENSRNQLASMRIVSEAGLYEIIFRSEKPEAKKFRRWVTHDVLPQIRKTGSYEKKPTKIERLEMALAEAKRIERLEETYKTNRDEISRIAPENGLVQFIFGGEPLCVYQSRGQTCFSIKEIADKIGIKYAKDLTRRLSPENFWRTIIDGSSKNSIVVNNAGLYEILSGSRKAAGYIARGVVSNETLPTLDELEEVNRQFNEEFEDIIFELE